jgi:aspartate ammonia-lyase
LLDNCLNNVVLPDPDSPTIILHSVDLFKSSTSNHFLLNFPSDIYQGGAGTSVNMNANEVIANLALELIGEKKGSYHIIHPNDHVNKCQSTNDAYPTAFRIALYKHVELLEKALQDLKIAFNRKNKEAKSRANLFYPNYQEFLNSFNMLINKNIMIRKLNTGTKIRHLMGNIF